MKKYRNMLLGMFVPENKAVIPKKCRSETLGITIPSPIAWDSESKAINDSEYSYRFGFYNDEVVLWMFYELPKFYKLDEYRNKYNLNGYYAKQRNFSTAMYHSFHAIDYYTFDKFKVLGGKIYGVPLDFLEEWNVEENIIDVDFTVLFPSIHKDSDLVYIDNQSYYIYDFID
ncbi:MAG: hypothetical protein IJR47_01530 [Clostridia bacterium]|nr:hypothetical protein [Clostridia bacterium]